MSPTTAPSTSTTTGEVWVKQGDPALYPTRQAATGEPDPAVDPGTAIIHWRKADNDYAGWGLHVWDGAATPTDWSTPLLPEKIDSFGALFRVPLAAGATGLNYIIHRGDTKDQPDDQRLDLTGVGHEVWLLGGVPGRLLPASSAGPAKDVDITKQQAQWIDRSTVTWAAGPTDGKTYALVAAPAGGLRVVDGELSGTYTSLPLRAQRNGLTEAQRAAFPHLWSHQAFHLDRADLARVPAALRGQLVVTERDAGGALLRATGVQIPGVLDDVYAPPPTRRSASTFAGKAAHPRGLGADRPDGRARAVRRAVGAAAARCRCAATTAPASGRRAAAATGRAGTTATGSKPGSRPRSKIVTASVTDPYSVALAADSTHSQIVDLADPALAPGRLVRAAQAGRAARAKAQISELSVRDFSIADRTVPAAQRGTYLAFTDPPRPG